MDYGKELCLESLWYLCEEDWVLKIEEFRSIPEYEGKYDISDLGRVKSLSYKNSCKQKIMSLTVEPKGYYKVNFSKDGIVKTKKIHQLVAIGFFNHKTCGYKLVVNHKNFIKKDNRKFNLEIVTARKNSNLKHIKSSSKYVGVCLHKASGKWAAKIWYNKKRIHLGVYDSEEDAGNAYDLKLKDINGKEGI